MLTLYSAVTAVYKGTPKNGSAILLRSYDSRKEPAPEFNCTIWQAGRATAANLLAFKPIQIGQSVFLDEGAGKYNPAPQILDEAVCNEWPAREVGVFVSIGTGKRPPGTNNQQHIWWEGFVSSGMGDFAEARRRLISKIEGCEDTHQYMLHEHLAKRQVSPENYYRLNVEVGVGEFGMNEWNRLSDISTNTRMYLSKHEVQAMNLDAAAKMSRIHRAKIRWERQMNGEPPETNRWDRPLPNAPAAIPPPSDPMAIELPAEDVVPPLFANRPNSHHPSSLPYRRQASIDDKFVVISSDEFPQPVDSEALPRHSGELTSPYRGGSELQVSGRHGSYGSVGSLRRSGEDERLNGDYVRTSPPPRPPKTPIQGAERLHGRHDSNSRASPSNVLPYPDTDGPPPIVNMARKPEYGVR